MRRKLGMLSILLGAALILSALFLYGYNQFEDKKSGSYAGFVLSQVQDTVPEELEEEPQAELSLEMPEVMIDGYAYIGYLKIPALSLELPVMADWDYPGLRIAPCRQFGSTRTDDLVIAAHNYDSFFGRLKTLETGAKVIVTDMEGIENHYEVARIETLKPTQVEEVAHSDYDLVLYTCTYGGQARVATFCKRSDSQ